MTRLHHIALGARDVARIAEFYRRFFDLSERARHVDADNQLRSIWLDLEGAVLMIERTAVEARYVDDVGTGPFLIAFTITTEARRRLEHELEAAGHPIEARTPFTSYTRDPEGNRVAFSHYPEPSR